MLILTFKVMLHGRMLGALLLYDYEVAIPFASVFVCKMRMI